MKHSKTSLFLMEFIIGILFFSLAVGLCVQIFVKAKTMNDESVKRSQAQLIATSIIENAKANHDIDSLLYFDEQGLVCTKDNYYYLAHLKKQDDLLQISITYQDQEIYTTEYYHYQQRIWEVST